MTAVMGLMESVSTAVMTSESEAAKENRKRKELRALQLLEESERRISDSK